MGHSEEKKTIKALAAKIEPELLNAFRLGTSANRLGLIPQGPSDHLPLQVQVHLDDQSDLKLISWNLLADTHLYNNFQNISGSKCLAAAIINKYPEGNAYYNNKADKLYYFFSELAQFLYKAKKEIEKTTETEYKEEIEVSRELLERFKLTKNQPSNLAMSRHPETEKANTKAVESAREKIIDILLNHIFEFDNKIKSDDDGHEFRLAITHSLELIHHIEHPSGALKWDNRFKLIKDNTTLVNEITNCDFLCLQECSNPENMLSLFKDTHAAITHRINDRTTDHCSIIYNKNKYQLIVEPIKHSLQGKKPCIFAKFRNIDSGKDCIVSSIHHPGGNHDMVEELLEKINSLIVPPDDNIPFYMLGDFNHPSSFFEKKIAEHENCNIISPKQSTMAGADYNNTNLAIDLIVTNQNASRVNLSRPKGLSFSAPAPRKLLVNFEGQPPNKHPSVRR